MIRRLTCPVCEKDLPPVISSESPLFPFCTERCKQIDFHRWTTGAYAIVEDLTPETLFGYLEEQGDVPEQD